MYKEQKLFPKSIYSSALIEETKELSHTSWYFLKVYHLG